MNRRQWLQAAGGIGTGAMIGNLGELRAFAGPAGISKWPAHVGLYKRLAGEELTLGNYEGRVFASLGQSAKVEVSAQGPWMQVRLNDVVVLRAKDTSFSSGFIGLRIYGDPGSPCDATYSNLTFR